MFGKRTSRVASFVAAGILSVLTAPGPAEAGPSCARVDHSVGNITQTVKITNKCRRTVSAIVQRAGGDSPCYIIRPGNARKEKWSKFQAFQGIKWDCA